MVGIGGTVAANSSTEQALALALSAAKAVGARTMSFGAEFLAKLPHYGLTVDPRDDPGAKFIAAVREADGLVIASPGYHGSISGLVKNALDWLEETAKDARPYIEGLPVGLIVTAYGWQATGSTLSALRAIVHALRGWPTPLGAAVNTSTRPFHDGVCSDPAAAAQLRLVGEQVVQFAQMRVGAQRAAAPLKASSPHRSGQTREKRACVT